MRKGYTVRIRKKNLFVIGGIALLVVAIVLFTLSQGGRREQKPTSGPMGETLTKQYSEEKTIHVTSSGFDPQSITVKKGVKIRWENKQSFSSNKQSFSSNTNKGKIQINSDPHPAHTSYSILNLGEVAPQGFVELVFRDTGTFTYHNHLKPTQKGTVIVK